MIAKETNASIASAENIIEEENRTSDPVNQNKVVVEF
jgi:hypothetical protein